jgi:hypothetical protein
MNAVTRLNAIAFVAGTTSVLILANSQPAAANQPPEQEWFATELAAVVAATSRFNPVSIREDREFMGAILHDGECYSYTVAAGERGRDRITVRITVDDDIDVIAFWHTHGAKYAGNRYFSDVDTRLVEKWRKPLYLADYTGALKVIAPGHRTLSSLRAWQLGLPARVGYAAGRSVTDASGKRAKISTRE